MLKLVGEDVREQIRKLEEQFTVAEATQGKQVEIEKRMRVGYERASKELDLALQEAIKRKEAQLQEMYKLQREVMAKRTENETARLKTHELQHELDILNSYSA